ncbi:TMEM14 family protein [Williamwhitmania taraxaci]|uniref:Zinc-finger n=1 Tax=Williamwhitmania taraxaci TaxID=1640674 RepID=A0A1G6H538_9BACT|nr:TMEM14 family protein [Williamwhitmania taraxaci]SDB89410.1 hypothetical protein SAMN05216323_100725 [Williamwhitmania taraxaci]
MDCYKFNLELQKMLTAASDAAAPEFTQHMNTCPKCHNAYAQVELLLAAISYEKKASPNFFLQGKVMDRILAEARATIHIRPIRWETAITSLVAGLALGIIIGTASYVSLSSQSENNLTSAISLMQDTESTTLEEYIFTTENDK